MPNQVLSIRSSHTNKVFLDVTEITANAGLGYPRLIIPLRFDLNPLKENDTNISFVILNVNSSLSLKGGNLKISDSLESTVPYKISYPNVSITYRLEFPLEFNRIVRIEEHRSGSLNLFLDLRLIIGTYKYESLSDFEHSNVQMDLEIPQSHWVDKVLPLLSYGEYFLVEIPKGNKIVQEGWNYIVAAEKCFALWDIKGTYGNCREVGVLLDNKIKEELGNRPSIKKWKRAIEKFNHTASLFLHYEELKNEKPEGDFIVGKLEAEHLLIVTKALLKYAEGLIQEIGQHRS